MSPRPLLVALACSLLLGAASARAGVFISELCDPRDNYLTDRFLEIHNSGPAAVDLAGWSLVAVANNVDVLTWPLSGTIQPGQSLVAGNTTTVTSFTVTFPGAWSSANGNWNGKVGDGARLVDATGTAVDVVVATATLFENADLVRNATVTQPNPVYTPSEWTSHAVTLATDASPGTHGGAPPASGPVISALVADPAAPYATDAVTVRAAVVDTSASIATVTLYWGTSLAAMTNAIPMVLESAPTYVTSTPIPAQPEGTTVFYRVEATSTAPVTTTTDAANWFVAYTLGIHAIQGESSGSPYAGKSVRTRGVVTARIGACFVIQEGSGPWSGVWVRSAATPAIGDSVALLGAVTEVDAQGLAGNTLLTGATLTGSWPGAPLPPPAVVPDSTAASEAYEGVLVTVMGAACTAADLGGGLWQVDDGTGALVVDPTGYAFAATLGTSYDVTGAMGFTSGQRRIHPRGASDVTAVADHAPPVIVAVAEESDSTFLVSFSEPLDPATVGIPGHYAIGGITATAAAVDPTSPARARITVPGLAAATVTLSVSGVADALGNATSAASWSFPYIDTRIPAGYYDSAIGLRGTALRAALHEIIKGHTVVSYDGAWNAYRTTDWKPNGKVWDVYSDVPGGTAPYEYAFEQTGGVGGQEGTGYTREHTWCKSWFGGSVSPMYSDLWIIYPCDTHVNGSRGVNPYGDVAVPSMTFLNGSLLGTSADAGYTGTVFEPIDAFKGDLARSYFYVCTRYFGEDAAWPGGPAMDGADLLPWANETYVRWSGADPVSQKERLRNGAIHALQHNRNPFIDHPEFVALLFDSAATAGTDGAPLVAAHGLRAIRPNPSRAEATIRFDLARRGPADLQVFDVAGRLVRTLVREGMLEAGGHEVRWDGRTEAGLSAPAGLYFCQLKAGSFVATRRMVRMP